MEYFFRTKTVFDEREIMVKKRHFLHHLYLKFIVLPRQARDKHGEKHSKKSGVSVGEAPAKVSEEPSAHHVQAAASDLPALCGAKKHSFWSLS
jgi:hypothetical protein